jgi:hypothetical protein
VLEEAVVHVVAIGATIITRIRIRVARRNP